MGTNAMQKELEELRAQVAELNRAREAESAKDQSSDQTEASDQEESREVAEAEQIPALESDGSEKDFEKQIQDLVDALEMEIKDTNPMTVLIIFALGVLIGRLLPR